LVDHAVRCACIVLSDYCLLVGIENCRPPPFLSADKGMDERAISRRSIAHSKVRRRYTAQQGCEQVGKRKTVAIAVKKEIARSEQNRRVTCRVAAKVAERIGMRRVRHKSAENILRARPWELDREHNLDRIVRWIFKTDTGDPVLVNPVEHGRGPFTDASEHRLLQFVEVTRQSEMLKKLLRRSITRGLLDNGKKLVNDA